MEDGRIAPDNNEEYLLYQTILGAWPWQMETKEDRENYVEMCIRDSCRTAPRQ